MGPRCYDLASLLNDSYVTHDAALVRDEGSFPGDGGGRGGMTGAPANLKALGTFTSITAETRLRRYIPQTLALVRANLEANRRWDRLRSALAKHLPELR
jgi:hypothetical protein